MSPLIFLLFFSGIFLLGFFGNLFFKKTKISDIFILILVGLLLGPIFNVIPLEIIELLRSFTPIFAAMALIILLFDGGLSLNFHKVISEIQIAFLYTIVVFILGVGASAALLHFVFGFDWLYGILTGVIIGGTSSAIIVPSINKSKATDQTKTIMTLESAITDIFCVVITIAIIGIIISQSINPNQIIKEIFSAFAISTVIGLVGGLIWIKLLRDVSEVKEFSYLLTLSFLFLLYVVAEYLGGNGAFCALIFGLMLGNAREFLRTFKMKEFTLEQNMTRFQTEISLLIKTFFFIYLGVIIDLNIFSLRTVLITLGLVLIILIIRAGITKLFFLKTLDKRNKNFMVALHARGLAAAVLATYPLSLGVNNTFTQQIIGISFLLILVTNFTTTIYFFIVEKSFDNKGVTNAK